MTATRPRLHFRHGPRCAAPIPDGPRPNAIECAACGFVYFFNPTVATAAFVSRADGRCLFIRRGREPGLGLLAPPGGFIDEGETAETAVAREIREEVGLEIADLAFLCSRVNDYRYKGVDYPVVDLFFTARAETTAPIITNATTRVLINARMERKCLLVQDRECIVLHGKFKAAAR